MLEQARSMSVYYDSRTKKICDSFIEEYLKKIKKYGINKFCYDIKHNVGQEREVYE